MKAINVQNGTRPAKAFFIDEIPDPEPKGDDILARIKAFGNLVELWKLKDLKYAEKVAESEKTLIHLPKELSWEQGASLPEVFMTAIQAMRLIADLKPGEDILIHAGASGVGLATIHVTGYARIPFVKLFCANKIFITVGTEEKRQLCLSIGADVTINYRTTDFSTVIKEQTNGKGVNIIFDMVGQSYWTRNLESAALDARIVVIAFMSGSKIVDFNMFKVLQKRISILTMTLRNRGKVYQGKVGDIFRGEVLPGILEGEVKTLVDMVYPWKDIVEVHNRLADSKTTGKIVCLVD